MARFMDFEYRYIDSELFLEKGICINKYLGSETSVIVPTQIDDLPVISIGDKAFCFCNSLESIIIPDSVTSIGDWAFFWCESLTSITIPDSVTSIGGGIFAACTSLKNINLPPEKYFRDKYFLYEIIDSCNVRINSCMNPNVSSIPSVVNNFNVTSIDDSAFSECVTLMSIEIPEGIISIGDSAFRNCPILLSIKIPDSLTFIGDEAFSGCESLSITFHESMKNTFLLDSIDETGDYDEI